jgi:glycosyltransferase involved in cell wall biosynthesis
LSEPLVSVVIETVTTREDISTGSLADDIAPTISALEKQTFPRDRIEIIIVVDDERAAGELRRRYPFAKFVTSARNYFAAKNAGAAAATAPIVALLDGDCQPDSNWLEMICSRFEPGVGFVVGCTRYVGKSFAAWTFSVPDFAHAMKRDGTGAATSMNINNVAFRREILIEHPFDERISRHGGCYFLFNELTVAGIRSVYEPRARTHHGYGGGLVLLKRHFERGYDGVVVYRLDDRHVLRGTRLFRRLGALALIGITARRIVIDWMRLVRQRRQIGIPAITLPYFGMVTVSTRLIELAGGFVAILRPRRYT